MKHLPVYVASFFVVCFCLYIHDLIELIDATHAYAFAAGTFTCLFTMWVTQPSITENELNDTNQKFDIEIWLKKDIPIENSHDDFNNLEIYADRVAALLQDQESSHQIAIRGDFGVGKSSLCKLIEKKLTKNHNKNKNKKSHSFIFTYVDGWGRDASSNAAQILEIIIEELSKHTDTSSLINIPENYVNALNNSGIVGFSSLGHLIGTNNKSNPKTHLEKIDNLLSIINKNMVVVLEDFDRNNEKDKSMDSLESLLERLKKLNKIHFILCLGQMQGRPIDKICTHIEDLVGLNHYHISKLITEFIGLAQKKCTNENIKMLDSISNISIPTEVLPLIDSPRTLKLILRRTKFAWDNLAGEINFYDLLLINILRFSCPEGFHILKNNISDIRKENDAEKSKDDREMIPTANIGHLRN